MSEAQDWYNKQKEDSAKLHKDRIQEVLKADHWDLQTVLQLKLNYSALEDDKHYTFKVDDEHVFNELLVNRLMYLAYLFGCRDIEQKSFERGYHACKTEMAADIEAFVEKYRLENDLN